MKSRAEPALLASFFAVVICGAVGLAPWPSPVEAAESKPAFHPTQRYVVKNLLGWQVLVHESMTQLPDAQDAAAPPSKAEGLVDSEHSPGLDNLTVTEAAKRREIGDRVLDQLRAQLYQVEFRLPKPAVEKLRQVKIWVEYEEPHHPCMVYHPDANWLTEHGMNPEKAGCVEIANGRTFLKWTIEQPFMVLHELSHGYHDQFLGGHGNPEVAAAYETAKKSGSYDSVLNYAGQRLRHYALTNPAEYFAESSEAFFGVNDFYPFVRAELFAHDPATGELMRRLWRAP